MQRISVDLPDPEGPQITMRSPGCTRRSMSRNTCMPLSNHLFTRSNWMRASLIRGCPSSAAGRREAPLQAQAVARHREAESKVNRRDEQVALDLERAPIGIGVERQRQGAGQFVQGDDGHQGSVLEE